MKSKKYKGIIFDFFGVISSEVAPIWIAKNFSSDEVERVREKYEFAADRGEISYDTLSEGLGHMTGIPPEKVKKEWEDLAVINPQVIELIRELKKNYKIALLSDAPSEFLRKLLKTFELDKLFDVISISGELGTTKQDMIIYQKVLDNLEMSPDEVVFIDDNPGNIERAGSIGIKSFLFTSLDKIKSNLRSVGLM